MRREQRRGEAARTRHPRTHASKYPHVRADRVLRRLGPRIERLLAHELSPPVAFEHAQSLRCDTDGCEVNENDGCLVVRVHELFRWLASIKPFESYCITVPCPQ